MAVVLPNGKVVVTGWQKIGLFAFQVLWADIWSVLIEFFAPLTWATRTGA